MNMTDMTSFRESVYTFYVNQLNGITITYPLDDLGGTPDPPTGQYDNIIALRSQLRTEVNKITSSYQLYLDGIATLRTKMEDTLLMMVAYIGAKFGTIIDTVKYPECAIAERINDTEGLTAWFRNYRIVLPVVNSSLGYFTFTQDLRNGTLNVQPAFTTFLTTINASQNALDEANITGFNNGVAADLKRRAMYMMFNTVPVKSSGTPIIPKPFILDTLKLRQVMTDFGWSFPSLGNIN